MQDIHLSRLAGVADHYRCDETGVVYSLEINHESDCYVIRNSGVAIGERHERAAAYHLMKQQARLDFLSAQGDAGAYSA